MSCYSHSLCVFVCLCVSLCQRLSHLASIERTILMLCFEDYFEGGYICIYSSSDFVYTVIALYALLWQ